MSTRTDGTAWQGTLGAFRFEVQGVAGGKPVRVAEVTTRIVDDIAPQWPKPRGMEQHEVPSGSRLRTGADGLSGAAAPAKALFSAASGEVAERLKALPC